MNNERETNSGREPGSELLEPVFDKFADVVEEWRHNVVTDLDSGCSLARSDKHTSSRTKHTALES